MERGWVLKLRLFLLAEYQWHVCPVIQYWGVRYYDVRFTDQNGFFSTRLVRAVLLVDPLPEP
jgi:hypothetical protein